MSENSIEKTYYQQGNVTITSARAVFGANTYALANITSVASAKIAPSGCLAGFLFLAGLVAFVAGLLDTTRIQWFLVGLGLVLFFTGYFINRGQRPSYVVTIGTAGAEKRAYTSMDEGEIQKIVSALNEAIVRRG